MQNAYDYVVVGAGGAGCAVAARLSEDAGTRVLLLEAGGRDRSPNIKIPAAFAKQFKTKLDWDYSTGPEPHLNDRELFVPRGKSLGGSSSMNAMMYTRGRPLDFDGWRDAGCPGWGWEDVVPYFRRVENSERAGGEFHGTGGPVNVSRRLRPATADRAASWRRPSAAGIPANPDVNSPEQDGRQPDPGDAAKRPPLERAPTPTCARREAAEPDRQDRRPGARSRSRRRSSDRRALARRSRARRDGARSGARSSSAPARSARPQLLMLSGIGPAEHLRAVGIEPLVDAARGRREPPGPPVPHCSATSRRSTRTSPTPRSRRRCSSSCCADPGR